MSTDPERVRELTGLVSGGMSPKEAARAVGVSYQVALRLVRASGLGHLVGATRGDTLRIRLDPDKIDWAIQAYESGMNFHDVGAALYVSRETARRILIRAGVKPRAAAPYLPRTRLPPQAVMRALDNHASRTVTSDNPLIRQQLRDPLLTSAEVAGLFHVARKTVSCWANRGELPCVRTVGGHHRFRMSDVLTFLRGPGVSVEEKPEP